MNNPNRPLNDFELALLSEMREHVTQRAQTAAAPAPRASRRAVRRWAVGLAAAAIGGIATVTSVVGGGAAPAAAYTVEDSGNAVTVTILDLTDEAGLEADLLEHGIEAEVNWRVDGDLPPDAPAGAPFTDRASDSATPDVLPEAVKVPVEVRDEEGASILNEWRFEPTEKPASTGPQCAGSTGETDPASFTKVGAAWELTIPEGSLLMDRHLYFTAYDAEDGVQVTLDYASAQDGAFCTVLLDD